ncbi:MAG: fructosamine kinase family protein [Crocinitomicaceae bacterium]|nr:fructosamine kinase family protein [Crocinitomicaceae bacterium]
MDAKSFFEHRRIASSDFQQLSGGDINQVYRVKDSVYKINSKDDFPLMFEKEAEGLKALSNGIRTPAVRDYGVFQDMQFLEIEHVEGGLKTNAFWRSFGESLAHLHSIKNDLFGFESSNYIGSLRQSNNHKDSWSDFLIEERLQPMIEMAVNSGEVNYVEARVLEDFYSKIEEIYPQEKPTLIHGDLWGGNYICSENEEAVLIDPAVYYGHREMDIGMMHLFGGFDSRLFDAYNEILPLEKGWKNRLPVNQLYPLLVHVNLFGRSYWGQVKRILEQFRQTH